ncbi:MAG: hypothetical protein KDA62_05740 [Planctomycetales bacterium]|nr:hypothetical protein [Planctomycetales bacterium]
MSPAPAYSGFSILEWDAIRNRQVRTSEIPSPVNSQVCNERIAINGVRNIEVWDWRDNRKLGAIANIGPCEFVAFDKDRRLMALCSDNTEYVIVDMATFEVLRSIPSALGFSLHESLGMFSEDATQFVYSSGRGYDTPSFARVNLSNGETTEFATLSLAGSYSLVDFGRTVVACGNDGNIDICHLENSELVKSLTAPMGTIPHWYNAIATTEDGTKIAAFTDEQIVLWSGPDHQTRRVLWHSQRATSLIVFGSGLVGWALVWAWLTRAAQQRRWREVVRDKSSIYGVLTIVDLKRFAGVRRPSLTGVGVAVGVFAVLLLIASMANESSGLLVLSLTLLGLSAVCVLPIFRSHIPAPAMTRVLARVKGNGRLTLTERLAIWTDGPMGATADVMNAERVAISRFRELTAGGPPRPGLGTRRPVLVMVFERHEKMVEFLGRPCSLPGVFIRGSEQRQIVLCRHGEDGGVVDLGTTLRTLFCYELLTDHLGYWPDWWIMLVVAQYVAANEQTDTADPAEANGAAFSERELANRRYARQIRNLQAAMDRGETIAVDELLSLTNDKLRELVQAAAVDWRSRMKLTHLLSVSAALQEYLLQPRDGVDFRPRFRRMLQDLTFQVVGEPAFVNAFGFDYQQLADHLRKWISQQQPAPPLASDLEWTDSTLRGSAEEQALRITQLASHGGLNLTAGLIELLDRQDLADVVREAAWHALRSIRGAQGEADLESWRAWQKSVQVRTAFARIEPAEGDSGRAEDGIESKSAGASPNPFITPVPDHAPVRPPSGLKVVWTLCAIAGLGSLALYLPIVYFEAWLALIPVAAGVFAIGQVGTFSLGRLRWAGWLMVATIFACNPVSMVLGIVILVVLGSWPVAWYLTWRESLSRSDSESMAKAKRHSEMVVNPLA